MKAINQNITRRTALAGAAALIPATAIPALALANVEIGSGADPIFAAIEKHRAAFDHWTRMLHRPAMDGELGVPAQRAAEEEANEAGEPESEAACELTNIVPTSVAGLIALLEYIDAFNRGEMKDPKGAAASSVHLWPEDLADDDELRPNGRPLTLPFAFWILRNVATAVRNLPGCSA